MPSEEATPLTAKLTDFVEAEIEEYLPDAGAMVTGLMFRNPRPVGSKWLVPTQLTVESTDEDTAIARLSLNDQVVVVSDHYIHWLLRRVARRAYEMGQANPPDSSPMKEAGEE